MGRRARTGVLIWRAVATSVAALVLGGAAATAATPSVPALPVPAPTVEVPSVPVPVPVPVPAPAPPPPPSIPSLPVTAPAPAPAPVSEVQAKVLGDSVRTAVDEVAEGSEQAVVSAGGGAPQGGPGEARRSGERGSRGRRSNAEASYRARRRVVHRLRGCIDELQPLRARVLVLRYGVGPAKARSAERVARRVGLTMRRYQLVRRRALRRLVTLGSTTGCRGSGAPLGEIARGEAGGGSGGESAELFSFASFSGSAAGGGDAGSDDRTAVLGEQAEGEGEEPPPFPESPATGALSLPDDPSDLPFLLAVGAFFVGFLLWVLARRRRLAHADPYERR